MQAVRFHEFGEPDVLRVEEVPSPQAGDGEVVIKAEAVSVGFAQTQMRRNVFPAPMWDSSLPSTLGGDVIGTIVEVGSGVSSAKLGDRVGAFTLYGAYAEFVAVNADTLVKIPRALDPAKATALPSSVPIAAGILDVGNVSKGETVLVHAASGGIGHIAVQLAKALGATVIGTASGNRKCEFVKQLGADVVVDYSDKTWPIAVRDACGGRGVDVVLDGVGGDLFRDSLGLLEPMGRLVFFGSAGGGRDVPSVSVMELIRLKYVAAFALSTWRANRPEQYEKSLADFRDGLASGRFRHEIFEAIPLSQAAKAHQLVESREHTGRIVLIPEGEKS